MVETVLASACSVEIMSDGRDGKILTNSRLSKRVGCDTWAAKTYASKSRATETFRGTHCISARKMCTYSAGCGCSRCQFTQGHANEEDEHTPNDPLQTMSGCSKLKSESHTPQIMAAAPPYGIARTSVLAMLGKSPMTLNEMPNNFPASSTIDRVTRHKPDLGAPVAR
jgi:hypothetical protein